MRPISSGVWDVEEEIEHAPVENLKSHDKPVSNRLMTTDFLTSYKTPSNFFINDNSSNYSGVSDSNRGILVTKTSRKGKESTHKLFFSVDNKSMLLSNSFDLKRKLFGGKPSSPSKITESIDIGEIDRVFRGQILFKSLQEGSSRTADTYDNATAFSIVYDNGLRSLDLIVHDIDEYDKCLKVTSDLLDLYQDARRQVHPDVLVAEHLWRRFRKKMNDKASTSELMQMMDELSVNLNKKEISALHKSFCQQVLGCKTTKLTIYEVADFMPIVRKRVGGDENNLVARVSKKIDDISSSKGDKDDSKTEGDGSGRVSAAVSTGGDLGEISAVAFQHFLRHKQKEKKIDLQRAKAICLKYNKLAQEKMPSNDYITKAALEVYLLSEYNDAFNPISVKIGRCDMNQPLSDYWINTSNKTYRVGGNEESKSLLRKSGFRGQSILLALYRGCRCIEIDIYDGGRRFKREPVVCESEETVEKTPDQVTLFVDVLMAVKNYMYAYPDTYPIILGIENHCSVLYQQKAASYLQTHLEKYLLTPTNLTGALPSPEALRGKVLLRGKRPDKMSTNPTVMCDDFDLANDLNADEAADYQNEVIEGDDDTVRYDVRAGNIDAMSIISDTPLEDGLSSEDMINEASENVFIAKAEADELEKHEFELTVRATQAEENVTQIIKKMGLTFKDLNEIEDNPGNKNSTYKNTVQSILRRVNKDIPKDVDGSFCEMLPNGESLSQSFDLGEQGIEVENYLVNGVEAAKKRVESVEAEAAIANHAASIALVELQEAVVEVREACEGLRNAQRQMTIDSDTARKARETAISCVEHAATAQQRVQTLKELLRKRKSALQHAESVFTTAVTEAKISHDRAKEAVTRADKAQEQADIERTQAESETRKEEDLEFKAAELHHKYLETVSSAKTSRERIDKVTHSIKNVDRKIKALEDNPRFKEERKEWFRQRVERGNENFVPESKLAIKHKQLVNERKELADILQEAINSKDIGHRHRVQQDFDDATGSARRQAHIASLARRQADKSTTIAERLTEQSEEELDAANLRLIASEKAEVHVKRCEDEYNSTVEQFAEGERAYKENTVQVTNNRNQADRLAAVSTRNTDQEEKIIKEKEAAECRARERYEAAEKVKTRLDKKKNEARNAFSKSEQVFSMARDEIAAETHRTNARKQQERNALIARHQASYLREKADEAKIMSDEARAKLAEAVAALQNAKDYKIKKDKIKDLSPDFAKLLLITTTKFKYWEKSLALPNLHMHSFSEGLMLFLSERGPSEWVKWIEFNKRHLTRTFPSRKLHKTPGNYNPMVPWAIGCQMVGMNTQSLSGMMLLVDGRFRENGCSGYVLKPSRLISNRIYHDEMESEQGKTLRLRIISGKYLPKPDCTRKKNPPISPRVKVIIYDGVPGKSTVQHTTRIAEQNGINPVWNDEGATFHIASPSVAIVLFSVWDRDPVFHKDYFIAASAIPFSCLRQGFRSVSLFDANRSRRGLFGLANIIVELSIHNYVAAKG